MVKFSYKSKGDDRMAYKCTYANGEVSYTMENASLPEVQAYYIGETFNLGNGNKQLCIMVEVHE